MATGSLSKSSVSDIAQRAASVNEKKLILSVLKIMGSLKITCLMFVIGVLLLFVGTLAQDEDTIVDVKKQYFNSWIAVVPLDVFVPQTIWPHAEPVPFSFAVPGGGLVGWILLINLIAAKVTRFEITSKKQRLIAGLITTAIGLGLLLLIIFSAQAGDGLQGEPPFSYDWIWWGCLSTLYLSIAGLGYWSIAAAPKHTITRRTLWTVTAILLIVGLLVMSLGDAIRIPNPGLRVVWQLAKSLLVGCTLLAGLVMLFGNRGGNVLIHLGVGLLMVGQFAFGDRQREERITLYEGQKTSAAVEIESVELAIIDATDADKNKVFAFDQVLLERSARSGDYVTEQSLPFEIRVDRWMPNSSLEDRSKVKEKDKDKEREQATMIGAVPGAVLLETAKAGGAKSEVNLASAYLTIRSKKDSQELGKFVVSQWLNDDQFRPRPVMNHLSHEQREYDLALRFRRNLKPFQVELKDVVLEQYTGTAIPKDYSSYVRITDNDGNTLQEARIWMNSPMRFRGETYYQSSYVPANKSPLKVEQTTLQVVTNAGWLIPYVACVLVGVGMLAHFGGTLTRFASRYDRNAIATAKRSPWLIGSLVAPLLLVGGYIGMRAIVFSASDDKIDWYRIGTLPVQHEGRMKPLSVVGAQVLKALSNKPVALTLEGHSYEGAQSTGKSVSSSQWLMSMMAHDPWVMDAPLIRIDSLEILDQLKLKRHTSSRYSVKEILKNIDKIEEKTRDLAGKEFPTVEEQHLMDLQSKIGIFFNIWQSYEPIDKLFDTKEARERLVQAIPLLEPRIESMRALNAPGIIPPRNVPETIDPKLPPPRWDAFAPAYFEKVKLTRGVEDVDSSDPVSLFQKMSHLIVDGGTAKSRQINQSVLAYSRAIQEKHGQLSRTSKVNFEAWYQHFNPTGIAFALYIIAGLVCLASFAVARESLRQAAFWTCILTLVVHTAAIGFRIYISERPPVVNLYSAAVFIGWAIVLACVVAESIFPIAIALLVACTSGFLSLQVADAIDIGDSMPVLLAVLDTQFWLSTHVVCVSLGYSATFLAGFLGIAVVCLCVAQRFFSAPNRLKDNRELIEILYRVSYGIVCFGIFFSFVGTVLGGLWGDDSWGRFWGWDPKENGAMMIVVWNALLLHAKWDKMVGALGFANLAIAGNIVTAWSMFGTNQLGIGLHSYGFTKGVLESLGIFAVSQIVLILIGITTSLMSKSRVAA